MNTANIRAYEHRGEVSGRYYGATHVDNAVSDHDARELILDDQSRLKLRATDERIVTIGDYGHVVSKTPGWTVGKVAVKRRIT